MRLREEPVLAWLNAFSKVPASTAGNITNRLVSVACALRVTPSSVVRSGASSAGEVTQRARALEDWLNEADSEEDALIRRMLLLMVCDKADEATPLDRIRSFVKDLHRHVNRH